MRKFIVSDLHGNGDIYDSIMAYLENISMSEEVELYINGDLIDRGLDSYRMLEDVVNRINNNDSIKIHYLGGNHELMMYNALKKKKPGRPLTFLNEWIYNGGGIIESKLDSLDNEEDEAATMSRGDSNPSKVPLVPWNKGSLPLVITNCFARAAQITKQLYFEV